MTIYYDDKSRLRHEGAPPDSDWCQWCANREYIDEGYVLRVEGCDDFVFTVCKRCGNDSNKVTKRFYIVRPWSRKPPKISIKGDG